MIYSAQILPPATTQSQSGPVFFTNLALSSSKQTYNHLKIMNIKKESKEAKRTKENEMCDLS